MNKRIGKFKVSAYFIHDNVNSMLGVMKHFLIIDAKSNGHEIEYIAYSNWFDEVDTTEPMPDVIPEYRISITSAIGVRPFISSVVKIFRPSLANVVKIK